MTSDLSAGADPIELVADARQPLSRLLGDEDRRGTGDRVGPEVVVREELTNRNDGLDRAPWWQSPTICIPVKA